jgi:3-methyladenine DNA glycosylase AlkC
VGALKDKIGDKSVAALADAVEPQVAGFDATGFRLAAIDGLGPLELKARIAHVASALDAGLPGPFAQDAPCVAAGVRGAGLDPWSAWPAVTWVEHYGLDDPDAALDALELMTESASAEFAIRPFIERHPELAWTRLHDWSRAADQHLRRLASEGTRPRLPWGARVARIDADPGRGLEIVERLRDDPSQDVRRSAANHLNDVARSHPQLALAAAARWMRDGGDHTAAVVRHALRGLVKRGDPRALALIGADPDAELTATLELAADSAEIGAQLPFTVAVRNEGQGEVTAVVDYAVRYARPSGRQARKVFKLATFTLGPGAERVFERRLTLRDVSIRKHHPGAHAIELLVNGRTAATAAFELTA